MKNTTNRLMHDFKSNRKTYLELEKIALKKINYIIDKHDFFVMDVTHRTKEPESLLGKLQRKNKYDKLTDITDLCGFRIICYFSDTVDEVAKALEEVFVFDRGNSVDKRASLQATQFGYLSLHCICKLKEEEGIGGEYLGIPFEIQIRTVLQHAWAEIEHDLGYKSDFGVPRPIRRKFSSVASLLEIADRQFIELRVDSEKYTDMIKLRIAEDDCEDIALDGASLKEFLLNGSRTREYFDKLKKELNLEISVVDSTNSVKQLHWFGIDTLGKLIKFVDDNFDGVFEMLKQIVEEYEVDIMSSGLFISDLCEVELIKKNYSDEDIKKFLEIALSNNKEKFERNFKKIIARRL